MGTIYIVIHSILLKETWSTPSIMYWLHDRMAICGTHLAVMSIGVGRQFEVEVLNRPIHACARNGGGS